MIKKFLLTAAFIIGGLLLLESALDVDHECRFDDFDEYVDYQKANGSFNTEKFEKPVNQANTRPNAERNTLREALYPKYIRQCRDSIQ